MNPLLLFAIQQVPGVIALIKAQHQAQNPNDPPMTDEQAHAILLQALASSLAKDDAYLAAHGG